MLFFVLTQIPFTKGLDNLVIPLYDSHTSFDTIKNGKNLPIASDYNAEITIKILSDKVFRNDKVNFQVIVKDIGILKMKEPYYYIFIVDGEENVIGSFPEANIYGYSNSKWTPWQIVSTCNFQGQTKDTIYQKINDTDWYISRNALLSSNGWMYYVFNNYCYQGTKNIVFTSKTNNILGAWQIYTFVFDGQPYCTRTSSGTESCYDYSNKLVAWNYNEFQVTDKPSTSSNGSNEIPQEPISGIDKIIQIIQHNQLVVAILGSFIGGSLLYFLYYRKK